MKKSIVILGTFFLLGTSAFSQNNFQFNIHLAPSVGDFRAGEYDDFSGYGSINTDDPNAFAGTGLGIGLEYHKPLGNKGLHLLMGIDAYRNAIRSDIRKLYTSELDDGETNKFPTYYNIPLSLGLHYEYAINEQIGIYGQGNLIYNILKITKSEHTQESASSGETHNYEYKVSGSFGFGFDVGLTFAERFHAGIGYKSLGRHSIQTTRFYEHWNPVENTSSTSEFLNTKSISMLNITFGITF